MTQPALCYPHPQFTGLHRPPHSDLHPTAGLPNNWALDFMAPGGTPVLASQDGKITRLSGHDPTKGVFDGDIFGWNIYLTMPSGVWYFDTHLGSIAVRLGQKVQRGQLIGYVGHWPGDPGRSHTHRGVYHPYGKTPAVSRIFAVADAPILPHAMTGPAV